MKVCGNCGLTKPLDQFYTCASCVEKDRAIIDSATEYSKLLSEYVENDNRKDAEIAALKHDLRDARNLLDDIPRDPTVQPHAFVLNKIQEILDRASARSAQG